MSHQVLARKWRPACFEDLVGQPHVVQALSNALQSGRLHHAYLFAGTRGVGKTTLGRILARCLNCETGVTATPCGECRSCVEIAENRHLDLVEVDAASRTRVDDTRELLDNVSYAPSTGRFKVYLIDEVHMLSEKSFNALLKTLEEPPEHVKFLLATTDPQKLPVTVLSRCIQFNLKPMPPALIAEHLAQVLQGEGLVAEEGALRCLGEAAEGSMRDALSLTDQAIAYAGEHLTEAQARDMLGLLPRTRLTGLLDAVFAGDGPEMLQGLAALDTLGPDWSRLLDELAALLHQVAVEQVVGAEGGAATLPWVREAAARVEAETLQLAYQIVLHGVRDLPYAPDPRMGVEMTLLRLLAFRPEPAPAIGEAGARERPRSGAAVVPRGRDAVAQRSEGRQPARSAVPAACTPKEVAPRLASGVREAGPEPEPAQACDPVEAAPVPPLSSGDFDWDRFAAGLSAGTVRELALNATLCRHDQDAVVIAVAAGTLHTERTRKRLCEALEKALGSSIRLEVVDQEERSASATPAARLAAEVAERQADAEASLRDDPVVRALGEQFGAELGTVRLREPGATASDS